MNRNKTTKWKKTRCDKCKKFKWYVVVFPPLDNLHLCRYCLYKGAVNVLADRELRIKALNKFI